MLIVANSVFFLFVLHSNAQNDIYIQVIMNIKVAKCTHIHVICVHPIQVAPCNSISADTSRIVTYMRNHTAQFAILQNP